MSNSPSTAQVARLRRPRPMRIPKLGLAPTQAGILLLVLGAWEAAARVLDAGFWISSPTAIFAEMLVWYRSGNLATDVGLTMLAAALGFVIGSLVGGIVGFVLGWVRKLGDIFEPFVLSLYTLPKVALAPLFVLWFGIGLLNKVMFASLLVFFMVFFTTFQGTRQVDPDLVANAKLLGASRIAIWTKIAIPFASVWLFTGLRIGLPYALIGAIVGEFVAAQAGVGYRIKEATAYFNTSAVFAGLLVLMGISFSLLTMLRLLERRVLRWQQPRSASALTAN